MVGNRKTRIKMPVLTIMFCGVTFILNILKSFDKQGF